MNIRSFLYHLLQIRLLDILPALKDEDSKGNN
jgi:hypothetical protein